MIYKNIALFKINVITEDDFSEELRKEIRYSCDIIL